MFRSSMTHVSLKQKLMFLVFVFVSGLVVLGWLSFSTVEHVKVNGPLYWKIVRDRELLADVSPAPACLTESYVNLMRIVHSTDESEMPEFLERCKQLKADYEARLSKWEKVDLFPATRNVLLNESRPPAEEFFKTMEEALLPAIQQNKIAEAKSIMNSKLTPLYQEHRDAIDNLVMRASQGTAAYEAQVARDIANSSSLLITTLITVIFSGCLIGFSIARGILKQVNNMISTMETVTSGDMSKRLDAGSKTEFGKLARAVNEMIDSLQATQITVTHGIEEMGENIRGIASNTNEVTRVTTTAVEVAKNTTLLIGRLDKSSREISNVVELISTIAHQTNLLALNASIESARAGDAGKGFAVVANEVKELAKETARATDEIGRKILAIQSDTQDAVGAIDEIGKVVDEINAISALISNSVDQQSTLTEDISRKVMETKRCA